MAIIKEWRDKNIILHQQSRLDLKMAPGFSLDNIIQQIHTDFSDLHACVNSEGRLIVKLGTHNSIQEMNWEDSLQSFVGFSQVFKMLVKSRKSLIGHNLTMDLMLMYHHFYEPLPPTLDEFKRNLLALFPSIIDTKQLCVMIRKEFNMTNATTLSEVYGQLSSSQWSLFSLCAPDVTMSNSNVKKVTSFHQAGNDAYSAGFVFLRIGHFLFMNGKSSIHLQAILLLYKYHVKLKYSKITMT